MKSENLSSEMERLQKVQDVAKTVIGTFGKLQNLLPNEMQNKLEESFEKLDKLQQITNKTDGFLKPHNNMEEKMSKLDQQTDKLLREMARLNINSSDPEERKACVEVLRSQQCQMNAALEKMPPGSPCYEKVKATIEKIEFACKEVEENSFGYLKNGALDDVVGSDLKKSLLDKLTAFTEKKTPSQQKNQKRR